MKKLYYTLALLMLVGADSQARSKRVGEKSDRYSTFSYKYPEVSLPSQTTFDFQIIVPYGLQMIPPSRYLATEMQLTGWTRHTESPEMMISLYLDNPVFGPEELRTRYEVTKDSVRGRNGKKVLRRDTTYYYSYRVTMRARAKMEATAPDGRVIATDYTPSFCTERMSREYTSMHHARRDLRRNADGFRYDMVMEWYDQQLRESNRIAQQKFGYYEQRTSIRLKRIGNKRHPEYARFNSNVAQIGHIMRDYRPTQNRKNTTAEIQKYIRYFDQVESKYSGTKRNDRKMRSLAIQNKVRLYELLDHYGQAQSELSKWVSTGIDRNEARQISRSISYERTHRSLNDWSF